MIPLPLLSTFQDVIGYTIIKTFNSTFLVGIFILLVFTFILFWMGASTAVIFVVGSILLLALSSDGGLLPSWVFFVTVAGIGGLVALAVIHLMRR